AAVRSPPAQYALAHVVGPRAGTPTAPLSPLLHRIRSCALESSEPRDLMCDDGRSPFGPGSVVNQQLDKPDGKAAGEVGDGIASAPRSGAAAAELGLPLPGTARLYRE